MPRKPESPQIVGPRQMVEVDHTVIVSAPPEVKMYDGPQIVSAPLKPAGEPVMVYVRKR